MVDIVTPSRQHYEGTWHRLMNVPPAIAVAEGEGDLSIAYWWRVHRELYEPRLELGAPIELRMRQ